VPDNNDDQRGKPQLNMRSKPWWSLVFPSHTHFNFIKGESWEGHVEKYILDLDGLKLKTFCLGSQHFTPRLPGLLFIL
jgi:hypothetical protein